jgi:hypothetical protein
MFFSVHDSHLAYVVFFIPLQASRMAEMFVDKIKIYAVCYVCMYVCMFVCMHVCMYACVLMHLMCVCMYLCMCVFMYIYIYTGLVKIMLTLMDYFSPADRRTPWVTD